jgi:CHAD domain-containing protein
VRFAFESQRYTALLLENGRLAESRTRGQSLEVEPAQLVAEPALVLASRLLGDRYRTVRRRGRGFDKLSHEDRLRIGVKKLRYAADCFRSLYDARATSKYFKRLTRLQDGLGQLNDVETADSLLRRVVGGVMTGDAVAILRASGLVVGWHRRGAKALERKLRKHWKQFKAQAPFWTEEGALISAPATEPIKPPDRPQR